jgi:transcriptional regulator with XRE-family HTH domain
MGGASATCVDNGKLCFQSEEAMMDWAERIRNYRVRSKLTQEQLAELFMVEPRTISRWETGVSQPPESVRLKLRRTHVPLLSTPTGKAVESLVTDHRGSAMMYDMNLIVLAVSEQQRKWVQLQYDMDPIGQSWHAYMGDHFLAMLAKEGGYHKVIKRGLSSVTTDFNLREGERGSKANYAGRLNHTIIRLDDGQQVHLSIVTPLGMAVHTNPLMTFIDEVMAEE